MGVFKSKLTPRGRLLMAIGLILTFAFVGVSLINYMLTRSSIRQEIISNDLPLTRDNIYSEISSELMRPILVSSSMASDTFLKDWALNGEKDIEKITRYLKGIKDRYDFFSTFFVSGKTGRYYHYKGLHKTVSLADDHDIWFFRFISSNKEYELDVDTDEAANNVLTIFINFRMEDSRGELLGVTGVGLKLDAVAKLITSYQEKYDRSIYLVDANGRIQVHPEKSFIEKPLHSEIPHLEQLSDTMFVKTATPANYQFEREGRNILLSVRYVPELDWFIFVEQDETAALANARMNFVRTVLFGLGASVIIIGLTLVTINRYQHRLESMAVTDELTGAANRRGLETAFDQAVYASKRYDRRFSLILLDLDTFKRVNDEIGHLAGDRVLFRFTGLVRSAIRPTDVLARWGGDEFFVLLESDDRDALDVAERIRQMVEKTSFTPSDAGPDDPRRGLTVCCGVTAYAEGDSLDDMVGRADRAMYECKAEGGNRSSMVEGKEAEKV